MRLTCVLLVAVFAFAPRATASDSRYRTVPLSLESGRTVLLTIGSPAGAPTRPKASIVFSHGANAAPLRYKRLFDHWLDAGFRIIAPLHLDSEEYPGGPSKDRSLILRSRLEDYGQSLDYAFGPDAESPDPETRERGNAATLPVYAAGHSYGAYIAQLAGGATIVMGDAKQTIKTTRAVAGVIAMSPPPGYPGFSPKGSWSSMTAPMLIQTGTADILPPFVDNWRLRLDSHAERPAGKSHAVIFSGVDHYFGGAIGRPVPDPAPVMLNALSDFAAISAAFMKWGAAGTPETFEPSGHTRFTALVPVPE